MKLVLLDLSPLALGSTGSDLLTGSLWCMNGRTVAVGLGKANWIGKSVWANGYIHQLI